MLFLFSIGQGVIFILAGFLTSKIKSNKSNIPSLLNAGIQNCGLVDVAAAIFTPFSLSFLKYTSAYGFIGILYLYSFKIYGRYFIFS